MQDSLAETWAIHNRINLELLDAISDDLLPLSLTKTRTIHDLFAHIHNVRLMWLQPAAPDLLAGLEKIPAKSPTPKSRLRRALQSSGQAIEQLFHQSAQSGGKIKGFKPHATAFLGYLISHESHHRGQIGWTLKLSGHPLDSKVAYALWDWSVKT